MKKQSLYAAMLGAALLIGGCKKQTTSTVTEKKESSPKMKTISASEFRYYKYGEDITEDDFLKNEHDEKDEQFNYVNHAMTLGLLEIYQNHPDLMASLVSEINESKNKGLNLYKAADAHPEIDDIMNAIFYERFEIFRGSAQYSPRLGGGWRKYVSDYYVYDTHYVPFIGFMNIGEVDAGNEPYVAEPLELNEEKFTQFDDDYPMWVKDKDEMKFTSVNEAMGYTLTNPIVRISNGFEGDDEADFIKVPSRFEENGMDISMNEIPKERPDPNGGGVNPGQQTQQYPKTDEWLTHVKFQINERYENWGKSEYQFVWAQSGAFNTVNFTWPEYSGHIRSIEKNLEKSQIGTMIPFYFDVFHSGNYAAGYNYLKFRVQYMPSSNYCYYAVGAFERDWGAWHKKLFKICTYNGYVGSPRKFFDEWYFIDPTNNDNYPFNTRNPNYHTSYWNFTKGVLQLHRWNL